MFQMSGARDISYFDAARRLASLTNADPKLAVSIKAADSGGRQTKSSVIRRSVHHGSPLSPAGSRVILFPSSMTFFASELGGRP